MNHPRPAIKRIPVHRKTPISVIGINATKKGTRNRASNPVMIKPMTPTKPTTNTLNISLPLLKDLLLKYYPKFLIK